MKRTDIRAGAQLTEGLLLGLYDEIQELRKLTGTRNTTKKLTLKGMYGNSHMLFSRQGNLVSVQFTGLAWDHFGIDTTTVDTQRFGGEKFTRYRMSPLDNAIPYGFRPISQIRSPIALDEGKWIGWLVMTGSGDRNAVRAEIDTAYKGQLTDLVVNTVTYLTNDPYPTDA